MCQTFQIFGPLLHNEKFVFDFRFTCTTNQKTQKANKLGKKLLNEKKFKQRDLLLIS